jgi:hypothetical protein
MAASRSEVRSPCPSVAPSDVPCAHMTTAIGQQAQDAWLASLFDITG